MEYAIVGLIAVIAICEVSRMVVIYRPMNKKKFFKGKLDETTRLMWNLEFKRFKTIEIREGIRSMYENHKSRIFTIEEALKDSKKLDKKILDEYNESLPKLKNDVQAFENQMRGLDIEIDGAVPSAEMPEGHTGISQQIDSLQEVMGMLRDWIKRV